MCLSLFLLRYKLQFIREKSYYLDRYHLDIGIIHLSTGKNTCPEQEMYDTDNTDN